MPYRPVPGGPVTQRPPGGPMPPVPGWPLPWAPGRPSPAEAGRMASRASSRGPATARRPAPPGPATARVRARTDHAPRDGGRRVTRVGRAVGGRPTARTRPALPAARPGCATWQTGSDACANPPPPVLSTSHHDHPTRRRAGPGAGDDHDPRARPPAERPCSGAGGYRVWRWLRNGRRPFPGASLARRPTLAARCRTDTDA